jgi:hypothetical protein
MAAVTSLGATFTTASGTKTVTATPAVNDLIVIVTAHSGNTANVAPTDNNGTGTYVLVNSCVKAASADTMQVWVRTALIASAVSTVFTHAPGTTSGGGLFVLKITGMSRFGGNAVRQSAIQSNQSASGTPAPVLPSVPLSANPIIGAVFNATSPATMTPRASYTEFSDLGYSTPTTGCEDMAINSGETSATITWGGTSASAFCSIALELDTGTGATPTLVQHVTGPQSELLSVTDSLTDYIIQLLNPVGSGNCVLVSVTHDNGSSATESVTDDQGNTYVLLNRVNDTTRGQFASVFGCFNATAGALKITVTFSVATVAIWGCSTEYCNVTTAAMVDVSSGNASSGTSVTAGSITPTGNGDLLYQVMFNDGSGVPMTGFTVGSQSNITWALIAAEKVFGTAVQYGVYTSISAINPTFTIAPTSNWISIAVALKSASAGTPPAAGIRVVGVQHNNTLNETATTVTFFWPVGARGNTNLLAIAYVGSAVSPRSITGVTDSSSNTWTQAGTGAANDSQVQIFYAASATAVGLLTVTVSLTGTNVGHGGTYMAFEVEGAATSPFDTSSTATGNNSSGNITADSITPSTANGLVISAIGNAFNTTTGITTSGSNFISIRSTGEVDPTTNDENNGWSINYNPNTSAIVNVYTHDTVDAAGSGNWAAISAAFKAPASGGPSFPPILLTRHLEGRESHLLVRL